MEYPIPRRPLVAREGAGVGTKGSLFEEPQPYFKKNKIAAYNWGFVAGKIQTQYPWASWGARSSTLFDVVEPYVPRRFFFIGKALQLPMGDIIPIAPGIRAFVVVRESTSVGITSDVEPVLPPAFAVVRG